MENKLIFEGEEYILKESKYPSYISWICEKEFNDGKFIGIYLRESGRAEYKCIQINGVYHIPEKIKI